MSAPPATTAAATPPGIAEGVREVVLPRRSRIPFRPLDPEAYETTERVLARMRERLEGQAIWHVNSSEGDGIADILRSVLSYLRDGGIDARWLVVRGDGEFHRIVRRIHNNLYGSAGDGGPLGEAEREAFERFTAGCAEEVTERMRPGDVVFLHDGTTARLVDEAKRRGATVIWRSHIGVDSVNEHVERARAFLAPYLHAADGWMFSRPEYAWPGLQPARMATIPPSLDPFSPKNQELAMGSVFAILDRIGLTASGINASAGFVRLDGSEGRVDTVATIDQLEPLPSDAELLVQAAGWERLKDPLGVLDCFADHCPDSRFNLVLAGPAAAGLDDGGEDDAVIAELRERLASLPDGTRRRVHLVQLGSEDHDESAAIVNAIQRRADIVVQKSLAEGFGLSVTEAMWKGKPIVGSAVGGIRDQITDGENGLLVEEPQDLAAFGAAITKLLSEPQLRTMLGAAARRKVVERYLTSEHVGHYLTLVERLRLH